MLVAVVVTVHAEQRAEMGPRPPAARHPRLGDVDRADELVGAPLPRAVMGYDPLAVRGVMAELAAAYSELAAASDPRVVEQALARARGRPGRTDAEDGEEASGPVGSGRVDDPDGAAYVAEDGEDPGGLRA